MIKFTEEELKKLLHDHVFYEILFAFGVSPHDQTDYCAWEHINFSRMGHARVLYNFFEKPAIMRKRKADDDIVSEDFGFEAREISRPSGDRERLNKDLFHLTKSRLRHTAHTKPWPDTILSCLHDRCVEFTRHVLCATDNFGERSQHPTWCELFQALQSGRELLIFRSFTSDGDSICAIPDYTLCLGRPLCSGLSELTAGISKARSALIDL